jgi:teichuronic acid biosynthesis glycosyltransferase TuaC
MTAPAPGRAQRVPERIVVLTTSYPAYPGDPSGHFVESEVRALRADGHEVTVIAPRPAGERGEGAGVVWVEAGSAFGWPGALSRLRERPGRALSVAAYVWRARRALARQGAVDRVVAHFALPSAWPIATRRGATRLEVVVHGSDARLIARLPAFLRARIARSLDGADVRTVSEELRQQLGRALGPALATPIRVQPPRLDVGSVPSRASARRELGVPGSERLVVVAGRLIPEKRLDVALGAASLLPGGRVVVLGDGPERARLARAFPKAELLGLVPRERALRWLAAADVVLSASLEEGAPSVVREARTLGTAVVALACGDLVEASRTDAGLFVLPAQHEAPP